MPYGGGGAQEPGRGDRMRTITLLLKLGTTITLSAVALSACSSSTGSGGLPQGAGGTVGAGGSGGSGVGGSIINTDGGNGTAGIGGVLNAAPPCNNTDPNGDGDGDGFTPATGDCNDCTLQMNPGAVDFPGNGVDEDCNGVPDDEPANCDTNPFDIGYGDPNTAAQVIGICRTQTGPSWGLISAQYTLADGSPGMNPVSHGLLQTFGPNVGAREGLNMLALSSGTARAPGDPGYISPANAIMGTTGPTPPGFPVAAPSCPMQPATQPIANDSASLDLQLKVPTNANAFRFDFTFYTYEYPVYICSTFNDFYVTLVDPAPTGAQEGNVSFDNQGNPVSVNNGFLEVCEPQVAGGKQFDCPQGTSELFGTGFDVNPLGFPENHAATGWLVTTAPVPPGQTIRVRFAIWDAGDAILDSTVLIDNFRWDITEGDVPVTVPIPK